MPLITERTTDAVARGKTLPREENRSTQETGARELISNTRARVTCPHSPHAGARSSLTCSANTFIFVSRGAGLAGLIVTSNVIGYSPFPEDSIGRLL